MIELLFILVFVASLLVTGLTVFGALIAAAVAFVVLMLLSMLGFAIKLLPWIIVIALGVWVYRHYQQIPR
ncbi:envelope stress response protein PspG [Vibrio fluvialis]|uniref:envelope stress response protein PspG n=1 Tax=Vibrio fluvialis TaxID=676 RepID=UPI00192B34D8|nr:envelope stress response protein PspG [Vibrio fluvialis]MBL4240733.1 envelope stress response protein PspG [Vibrio fluvialis]MBL4267407.1 envelope stress response protein PspG [Vibrio fluvialis]MBL4271822.1 envelope stress response protein PspG [Vibrio fluvialis]MBL4276189.1 envelope stress response protein PspG [Vibrio fluvialis]MBO1443080.1 envelope stress response protein PspG [Vibrio fluvialis]